MSVYGILEGDEVRMLTIVDPSHPSQAHLVHCELEHVSLDDFSRDFEEFMSSTGSSCNPPMLRAWVERTDPENTAMDLTRNAHLSLPRWRKVLQDNDQNSSCSMWIDIMDSMSVHSNRYGMPDSHQHFPSDMDVLRFPELKVDPRERKREKSEEFCFLPRFRWGEFEAISYCWESEVRDRRIILNGVLFSVPTNLEALLQQLNRKRCASSRMKFWIDALCINQSDVAEKNHQVKLMHTIYTRAFAVIVWLGEAAEESENATDIIAEIAHYTLCRGKNWGKGRHTPQFDSGFEEDSGHIDECLPGMPWKALLAFLSRSYWQRLWIIQELALNHNMTLFMCGERQLSRGMIRRACEFCMRSSTAIDRIISKSPEMQHESFMEAASIWSTDYQVNSLITTGDENPKGETLDTILDLSRRAQVTDPRDKIYGLLGLLPEAVTRNISPNYKLTQEQVYTQFATTMINASKTLDPIFSWCTFDAKAAGPSWIPNWMTRFSRNRIQWLRRRSASASASPIWSLSNDGRRLCIKGFIVDTIRTTSASQSENLPYQEELLSLAEPPSQPSSYIQHPGNEDTIAASLRRVLIMWDLEATRPSLLEIPWIEWKSIPTTDLIENMVTPPHPFGYGLFNLMRSPFWKSFDRFRQTNANFTILGRKLRDFFPELMGDDHFTDEGLEIHHSKILYSMTAAVVSLVGRRLINTTHGYLGLAPEATQEGDVIAIVYGCNFPVILRPHGKMYQVIGESYIDGIMDGELMEPNERERYPEVHLTLC